jgi:hypothetical protein
MRGTYNVKNNAKVYHYSFRKLEKNEFKLDEVVNHIIFS